MISQQQINLRLSQDYYSPHLEIHLSPNYFAVLNQDSPWPKDKRDDSRSPYQRKAANERERKRMHSINKGFDCLRERLPTPPYAKKLSKVETLKNAIDYIYQLGKMLEKNCNNSDSAFNMEEKSENFLDGFHNRRPAENNVDLRDPRMTMFEGYDRAYGSCTLNINWQNSRDAYSQQFLAQDDQKYGICSSTWVPPSQSDQKQH